MIEALRRRVLAGANADASLAIKNTAVALLARSSTFIYSFVVVGWAARHISTGQTRELLLLFNVIAAVGILQAGLGVYVARQVARSNSALGDLSDLADVRTAFRLVGCLVLAGLAVVAIACFNQGAKYLGILVLTTISAGAGLADQVRLGRERSHQTAKFQFASYSICLIGWAVLAVGHNYSGAWISLVAYGPAPLSAVLSFAFLLTDSRFRKLLFGHPGAPALRIVAGAWPLFLSSAFASLFLNVPLISSRLRLVAGLSPESAALFRMDTAILAAFYLFLQPSTPTLMRLRRSSPAPAYRKAVWIWAGSFAAVAGAAGLGIGVFAGPITHLWLGLAGIPLSVSETWGLFLFLWLMMNVGLQYTQFFYSPVMVCFIVASTPILALSLTVTSYLYKLNISIGYIMLASIFVSSAILAAMIFRLKRRYGGGID